MRVLFLSDNPSDHNRRFVEAASKAGYDAWFLDITAKATSENWSGVHTLCLKRPVLDTSPAFVEAALPEFLSVLKRIKPDVLHAGPLTTCGYLAALSRFNPIVVSSWGFDLLMDVDRGSEWREAIKCALRAADGFQFDSETIRKIARDLAHVPDDKIVQFPWGIKSGTFSPHGTIPAGFNLEPESIPIICTRSWEPMYAIDVLLRAFLIAHARDPRLRLLLVGEGSEESKIRGLISESKLQNAVITPGKITRSEIPACFRAAKVYVSCAKCDSTSVSLLEAMATGLPVVVTDIPSNREWITNGRNGWLAPEGDAEQFADAILQAAALDQNTRAEIATLNQQIVHERADWDKNIVQLFRMYKKLIREQTAVAV